MNTPMTVDSLRIWSRRTRASLLFGVLLSTACPQQSTPAAPAVPPAACPPAGSRVVNELALFAQCLGASIKTPPGIQGSNNWQDYGTVKVGDKPNGWVMVEPRATAKPLEAAWFIEHSIGVGLVNQGNNVHLAVCPSKLLTEALENTILTVAIQIDGNDEKGQYLIYGGRMGQDSAPTDLRKPLVGVSRAAARKAAVAMARQAVGAPIENITSRPEWADALH